MISVEYYSTLYHCTQKLRVTICLTTHNSQHIPSSTREELIGLIALIWIIVLVPGTLLPLMTDPTSATATATATDSASWVEKNKVCHSLPCSIDYQGMAPVHAFFHPMPIHKTDGSVQHQQQQVRFRGRKLLAATPPVPVQGMVLQLSQGSDIQDTATTTTTTATATATTALPKSTFTRNCRQQKMLGFHSIQEWHHEETLVEIGTSRVETANLWFPIARAMHEELDVVQSS